MCGVFLPVLFHIIRSYKIKMNESFVISKILIKKSRIMTTMEQLLKEGEEEDVFYSPERAHEEDERDEEMQHASESNTEEVKQKLREMRLGIQKNDFAFKETDDSTLRRFLVARDLEVEKATEMFLNYCRWRRSFVPNGSVSESEIGHEIAAGKAFVQGVDRKNRPIAVVFGAKHFPCKGGMDEFKRFVVFAFDKVCSRMSSGQEKFTIIADIQGYSFSNVDVRGYIAILAILQDYYPERLGILFIIHAPYAFMTAWKIVYPFIDKNTRKKILFVEKKKLKATFMEEIDKSELPEIYGGKLKLVPIQDA